MPCRLIIASHQTRETSRTRSLNTLPSDLMSLFVDGVGRSHRVMLPGSRSTLVPGETDATSTRWGSIFRVNRAIYGLRLVRGTIYTTPSFRNHKTTKRHRICRVTHRVVFLTEASKAALLEAHRREVSYPANRTTHYRTAPWISSAAITPNPVCSSRLRQIGVMLAIWFTECGRKAFDDWVS